MDADPQMNWVGALVLVMPISVFLTVPVAVLVRKFYADRVRKYMGDDSARARQRAGADWRPPTPPRPTGLAPPPPIRIERDEGDLPLELSAGAEELRRRAVMAPRLAALVYALAGVAHAAIATAVLFVTTGIEFLPGRTLATVFAFSLPVVPTVTHVAISRRRHKVLAPLAFVAAVLLLAHGYRYFIAAVWAAYMLAPSALMLLVANRRLRSVGPVVLVFMSVFVFGIQVSVFGAYDLMYRRLGSEDATLILIVALCSVIVFTLLAFASILSIRWRYEFKWASDQSIVLNLYWLLFTEWQCLLIAQEAGLAAAAGMLAFVGYAFVRAVGFWPLRRVAERRGNVRLLLLRVFGSQDRSERAFEELSLRWRYVGSIQLIAGRDLAVANLEPHEFLDFLNGGLRRRFVKGGEDFERRVRELDVRPDPDGRFRVNEFFCHADTWRPALVRLLDECDVVLMDLRGFEERNEGIAFELRQLINKKRAGVVMVYDDTTEIDHVERILREAWGNMAADSPNRHGPARPLRLMRLGGNDSRDARRLLSALCAAARPA